MIRTAAVAVLLLAACSDPPAPSENRAEQPPDIPASAETSSPAEASAPPGANANTAGEPDDIIPAKLHGRWTGVAEDCANDAAELALEIGPKQLLFHESAGTVSTVAARDDGGARVEADFTGEGQSWTRTMVLTPSSDGQRLTVQGDGMSIVRKRCPR